MKMDSISIEKLFNSIIKSNSLYYKINLESLLNEINSYIKIDSPLPKTDPDTLVINTIEKGQDNELYIVRKLNDSNIWILIPKI